MKFISSLEIWSAKVPTPRLKVLGMSSIGIRRFLIVYTPRPHEKLASLKVLGI